MNKEFIPYEQALELKELGFNEECLGYHNIDPYLPNPTFNLVRPFEHEWCLPAPLYQQAFRYFTRWRGLFSNIIIHDDKTFSYTITYFTNGNRVDIPIKRQFKEYDEAKLACLKELIEIDKTEKKELQEFEDQFGLFLEGKQTREEWKSKFPQHFPK